ncbi:MAG: bifunctional diaminohydroxyphosphoribosylaminopyrimidine deaminase/5-amino-6-(5-phosphoribosylamino)uracil reductase RibD [Micrococcaceae bacterium]
MPETTTQAMQRALDLASSGIRGANPLVGAVITDKQGTIVAEGYHQGSGTPHAEIAALEQLPQNLDPEELTLYVTLEPCNHTGHTGPCTQAIIKSGIKHVVIAALDPTERASGGQHTLKKAGISVENGILEAESLELNNRWFQAQQEKRPFVTVKFAQTLDGKIAAIDASSQWITGEEARKDTHRDRTHVDALIIGTGTLLADNPALTARIDGELAIHQPKAIVIGYRDIPQDALLRKHPAGFQHFKNHNLKQMLLELRNQGMVHVMVEGGASLLAEFFKADLVDNVVVYLAPKILGSGKAAIADMGIKNIKEALELEYDSFFPPQYCGNDMKLHLIPHRKA